MNNKLYVGNLSFQVQEDDLRSEFTKFGEVVSVKIITDRDTGRSKGFGFVEMATQESADATVETLNGTELQGRAMKVNIAKPQEKKSFGGSRW